MFTYWGRRGAITQMAREIADATQARDDLAATISVSRQNESFAAFEPFADRLFAVQTFMSSKGAAAGLWRVPALRRQLLERLKNDRTDIVVDLMPHVWAPFLAPAIRSAGVRYAPFVHDPEPHRGDRTALFNRFALRALAHADQVICLSASVRDRLIASGRAPADRIITLFHPDYDYGARANRSPPKPGEPWRLLFLGRIMAYKGLDLFVTAAEHLKRSGRPIEVGVFGEGPLGDLAARLDVLGAEVVNRWLDEREISGALDRYHVMVLSHTNASQSGVVAAAHGAGMPIVSTPVGGLLDQISDGKTGLFAARVDADSLAQAIDRLISEPDLYDHICRGIEDRRKARSVDAFLTALVSGLDPVARCRSGHR